MQLYNALKYWRVFLKCVGRLSIRHLFYMAKMLSYERVHSVGGQSYVNSFFPGYPSAAFDRFLDTVFARKRVPYTVYFAVTDKCPYSCGHCSYGNHTKGSLDTSKAKDVIKQICDLGTVTIGFTGGEPLLRSDVVELVDTVDKDCNSIMFTTGFGLSQGKANGLKEAGLKMMTVGFESYSAEKHDTIRGKAGSFEEGVHAVDMSLKAGMFTAISTVATRQKVYTGAINRMAEMARKLGVHEFRILEPVATGSIKGQEKSLLVGGESEWLTEFHKCWNRQSQGVSIASFSHLESGQMFGCGAGYYHLFVDALGTVCPCDLTPFAMGNVTEELLADIWERMGLWFGQARSECLMRDLCKCLDDEGQLPVCREQSEKILSENISKSELPKIFENLLG